MGWDYTKSVEENLQTPKKQSDFDFTRDLMNRSVGGKTINMPTTTYGPNVRDYTYSSSTGGNNMGSNNYFSNNEGYDDKYESDLGDITKSIDDYTNELIGQYNGDYDFVAKWIEANYAKALGTDDVARAEFLKKVANDLEAKVGRIQFDYNTGTYRLKQDTDLALARLAEDEQVLKKDLTQQSGIARENQMGNLNARGLITGARQNTLGLGGKEVGQLETEIGDKFSAMERAIGRSRDDINLNYGRGMEDFSTKFRRMAQDEQGNRDYGIESAQRTRDKQIALAKAQASAQKKQAEQSLFDKYYRMA